MLVISHDRWFLDRIATHILAFEGDSQSISSTATTANTRKTSAAPGRGRRAAAPVALQAAEVTDPARALARGFANPSSRAQTRDHAFAPGIKHETAIPRYARNDNNGGRGQQMNFITTLKNRWSSANSLVCVGLDPEPAKFPAKFGNDPDAIFDFCRESPTPPPTWPAASSRRSRISPRTAPKRAATADAHILATHPGIPCSSMPTRRHRQHRRALRAGVRPLRRGCGHREPLSGSRLGRAVPRSHRKGGVFLCSTCNPGARDFQESLRRRRAAVHPRRPPRWRTSGTRTATAGWSSEGPIPKSSRSARARGRPAALVPGIGAQGGDSRPGAPRSSDSTGLDGSVRRGRALASGGDDHAQAARNATKTLCDEINRYR